MKSPGRLSIKLENLMCLPLEEYVHSWLKDGIRLMLSEPSHITVILTYTWCRRPLSRWEPFWGRFIYRQREVTTMSYIPRQLCWKMNNTGIIEVLSPDSSADLRKSLFYIKKMDCRTSKISTQGSLLPWADHPAIVENDKYRLLGQRSLCRWPTSLKYFEEVLILLVVGTLTW